MSNPLQNYFRQPKIYIKLPSQGVYNQPGTIQGDVTKLPVFGLTGMDEMVLKTPDALLTGESTARVVESCIPAIKDAWDISSIDMNLILVAIRIATYGNILNISHTCPKCQTEHDYDIDLVKTVDYFNSCQYNSTIELNDLTIKLKPLTYKQISEFSLKNYQIQQQAAQLIRIPEEDRTDEHNKQLQDLYTQLAQIQTDIYLTSVDSVQTSTVNVTEQKYITEWLKNSDKVVFDSIKELSEKNVSAWIIPPSTVVCSSCSAENQIAIDLDQSNFFVKA